MSDLALRLPDDFVEEVAHRVAEILAEREPPEAPSPWLDAAGAAEYLSWPRQRIYKLSTADRIPHRKHEGRLLFRRDELDAWLDESYRRGRQ